MQTALAQEVPEEQPAVQKKSQFRGITQFVNGDYDLIQNDGKSKKLEYKDVIGSGYHIKTEKGPHAKFKTLNRCTLVLHKGDLYITEEQWWINGTTRMICKDSAKESFRWRKEDFILTDGEAFLIGDKVYVFNGNLFHNSQQYGRGFYQLIDGVLKPVTERLSGYEHYEINTQYGTPQESVFYGKPPPDRHATSRWFIGAAPLGITSLYHNEPKFSFHNSQTHMVKIGGSFGYKSGGISIALAYVDSKMGWEEGSQDFQPSSNPPQYLRTEAVQLEVTYKFDWQSSFTPYVSVGILENTYEINSQSPSPTTGGDWIDANVKNWGTSVSLGVEKIFFYNNWISLFLQSELSWTKTWRPSRVGPRSNTSQGPFPKGGEDGLFNQISGRFFIGPMIQFF